MNLFRSSELKQKYELGEIIGTGTFSEVREAVNKDTGQTVAIKLIEPKDKEEEKMLKQEIEILGNLNHPNVIHLIEVFDRPTKVLKNKKMAIVMEMLSGGELLDRILDKTYFLEPEARSIMKQLLEAITYYHSRGIVHRDLKPGNILFSSPDDNSPIKVADFGCATYIPPENPNHGLSTVCGTPAFVAPEVINPHAGGYGKQADMWSVGVILYTMLCGCLPFNEDDDDRLFAQIIKGDFVFEQELWAQISEDAKDLIRKCLTIDPLARITAQQAQSHPWMVVRKTALEEYVEGYTQLRARMARRRLRRLTVALVAAARFQKLRF
eukprot:c10754_g1_i2.p1 GENE.c10754_g1_i2~~c10754_g1_i2.p1  ORF type:complete len:324 (+),score=91.11 c10754_g1_i2:110-1081(+)